MKKNNLKSFCEKHLTSQNIKMAILFIPLIVLFIGQCRDGQISLSAFLDTSVLVSFLLVFLCDAIAATISHMVGKKYEDMSKLSTNYEALVKKYSRERLIEYQGTKFPVICLTLRTADSDKFDIHIHYSEEKYQLPKQIADNSDHLMKAHSFSTIYNNMNVRINSILTDGSKISIDYSMTTYFDSLITNRAMDYPFKNGKTIREIYEPGPFLSTLSESKLSNHLGFNGFVETADEKFIFVLRSDSVSIGKSTLADSIGASLKVKYCFDDDRRLTLSGIESAIRGEIHDELRINVAENVSLSEGIFAFYRDIVEGGKPQFLFYYKCNQFTSKQFEERFRSELKENHIRGSNTIIDGKQFVYLSLAELKSCVIAPGKLTLPDGKTSYSMMPSASASIVMLLQYLQP